MSLQYIIDGYNIVNHPSFAQNFNKKISDSRIALLEFIRTKKLCGSPKNKIIVVFDGYSNTSDLRQNEANINIIFSRSESADERIKKIIETSSNFKNIVVVSDDKEIKLFVKSVGSRSLGVEEFINRKKKSQEFLKKKDLLKPELTFSQINKINQELKRIWLK